MTRPLRYVENQFVKLSRGTLNGLPLLMPGKDDKLGNQIRDIFRRNVRRFGIIILALNVEPCGYEAVIFDPDMRRSEFLKAVNQGISMKVKKSITHTESVWSNCKPGNVPILDFETLENEIIETCVSPVRKGYVEEVAQWLLPHFGPFEWQEEESQDESEGLSTSKLPNLNEADLADFELPNLTRNGGPGLFNPHFFASEKGPMGVVFTRLISAKSSMLDRISAFETAEKKRRKKSSQHVLGVEACRTSDAFLAVSTQNRRDYSAPKMDALCVSEDRLNLVVSVLKTFYASYRRALLGFVKTKDVIFPSGVLKMRTLFGVAFSLVEMDDAFHFLI